MPIYPAHAGINLNGSIFPEYLSNLPRTRGDKPMRPTLTSPSLISTPHTRG